MKQLIKLPKVKLEYVIASEEDEMYAVVEHKETLAHIVETLDGTRQALYFPDGGVMHFDDTDLHQVMSHVTSRTNLQMAWLWFEENGYHVSVDEGNGHIEINVVNLQGTDFIDVLVSNSEIDYRAQLWIESRETYNDSKVYEVGIDEGYEIGTHTIATFITEAEAKEFMSKYLESNPTAKLFIDTITSDFIKTI